MKWPSGSESRCQTVTSMDRLTPEPPAATVWIPGGTPSDGLRHPIPRRGASPSGHCGRVLDGQPPGHQRALRQVRPAHRAYVTIAERPPDPADYPGATADLLVPASTVFSQPTHRVDLNNPYNWSITCPAPTGAIRKAQGPGEDLIDHPVVHVA